MTYFRVIGCYEYRIEDGILCKHSEFIVPAVTRHDAENALCEHERGNSHFVGCWSEPASAMEIRRWFYSKHTLLAL